MTEVNFSKTWSILGYHDTLITYGNLETQSKVTFLSLLLFCATSSNTSTSIQILLLKTRGERINLLVSTCMDGFYEKAELNSSLTVPLTFHPALQKPTFHCHD